MSPEANPSDRIRNELRLVTRELEVIRKLNTVRQARELDAVELRAAASSLHAVYNGLERCFLAALRARNVEVQSDGDWHNTLLKRAEETGIASKDLIEKVRELMGFRHFYRHAYGFMLDGDLMAPLLDTVADVVEDVRQKLGVT